MYTMLDNRKASQFDLHFRGQLVASLHYCTDENEILFSYCEAIATVNADRHCRVLMQWAMNEALTHWAKAHVACPIALKYLSDTAVSPRYERREVAQMV